MVDSHTTVPQVLACTHLCIYCIPYGHDVPRACGFPRGHDGPHDCTECGDRPELRGEFGINRGEFGINRGDGVQELEQNSVELYQSTTTFYFLNEIQVIIRGGGDRRSKQSSRRRCHTGQCDTGQCDMCLNFDSDTRGRGKSSSIGRHNSSSSGSGKGAGVFGGGRSAKQCLIRELLMEWYSVNHPSVDVKLMVRIPKSLN